MRTLKTILSLAFAATCLTAIAQNPPPPPIGAPGIGPGGPGVGGPIGPDPLMDPAVQRELHLSESQIARIRALRPQPPRAGKPPVPPKAGSKPPVPPKPGAARAEDAKIDAILSKTQRAQLRAIRQRRERRGPADAPRPGAVPPR